MSILIFTNKLRQRTCSPEQWTTDKGTVKVKKSQNPSLCENGDLSHFHPLLKWGIFLFEKYCVPNRP